MKKLSFIIFALVISACSAIKKPVSINTDKSDIGYARRGIDSANAIWVKAMRQKDAATISKLFDHSGAMLTSSGKVYQGRDAIEALMNKNFKILGPVVANLTTDNVWVEGNTAYESGRWQYTFIPNGSRTKAKEHMGGKYLVIWQRQSGTWQIIKDFGFTDYK